MSQQADQPASQPTSRSVGRSRSENQSFACVMQHLSLLRSDNKAVTRPSFPRDFPREFHDFTRDSLFSTVRVGNQCSYFEQQATAATTSRRFVALRTSLPAALTVHQAQFFLVEIFASSFVSNIRIRVFSAEHRVP